MDNFAVSSCRDAPEPTGEEPEDADLEAPKIYELVFVFGSFLCQNSRY